jgi:hypothetical protein
MAEVNQELEEGLRILARIIARAYLADTLKKEPACNPGGNPEKKRSGRVIRSIDEKL